MYRKFNLHAMVWRNLHRCVWLTTCACVSCLRARVHIMMQIVCRSADLYNVNKYLCLFFQQINFMSRCILFSYVLTLGKDLYKIILLHTRKYMKIFAIRDIYICIDIQSFRFSFPVFISQEHKNHALFTHALLTRVSYVLRVTRRYNQRLINVIDDDQLYLLALLRFIHDIHL